MLVDSEIRRAKPRDVAYKLTDSNGLYLEIKPNGAKAWRYRYRIGAKENLFAIGNYPTITLKDARKLRDEARDLVKKGIHPAHKRRADNLARQAELDDTVESFAREWFAHKSTWRPGYRAQVQARLSQDVFPRIGRLPVKDVTSAHLLDVLERIEKRSPVQAKLTQVWVGGLFRFAVIKLRRTDDPTYAIRGAIKTTTTKHHAKLKHAEIGAFLRALDEAPGGFVMKAAIRFAWLTAARGSEAAGARWDEIDLAAGIWRIPACRMKGKREHVVPLSRQALEIIRNMTPDSGHLEHVFPQMYDRTKAVNPRSMVKMFIAAGYQGRFTPHGMRGTFSTVANESKWRSDAIELCLAHAERDKTRDSYNAALLIDERRELLQWWADLSDSLKDGRNVIPFRQAVA